MESLTLPQRKLSREDFLTGVGGSVVAHITALAIAVFAPWGMTKSVDSPPFCTVNLVSMQDMGGGPPAPKKGSATAKASDGPKVQDAPKAAGPKVTSSPLVPVKRLAMNDPTPKKIDTEIKKLDAPEVPKVAPVAPSTASVDKSLEKMIPKPKVQPKPAPIKQESKPESEGRSTATAQSAAKPAEKGASGSSDAPSSQGPSGSSDTPASGSPTGSAKGVADKNAKGTSDGMTDGSPGGSPDGSGRVSSALLNLYGQKIKSLITSQWAVPDSVKQLKLETRLAVIVSKDGKVIDLRVEKGSGNSLFDESAVRAVRKASPLPAIPAIYAQPTLEIGIRFRPEGLS